MQRFRREEDKRQMNPDPNDPTTMTKTLRPATPPARTTHDTFFAEIAIKVATERLSALLLLLCATIAGCAGCRAAAVALGIVCFLQGCRAVLWSVAYRNTRRSFPK